MDTKTTTAPVLVTLPSGNQAIYEAPPQRPGQFYGEPGQAYQGSTDQWVIEHGTQLAHELKGYWFMPGGWRPAGAAVLDLIRRMFPEARVA